MARRLSATDASTSSRVSIVRQALEAPPQSLYYDRGQVPIPKELDNTFGHLLMQLMGFHSKKSQLLHGGQRLYEAIQEHVDSGVLQKGFQTGKVFWSSYIFLSLHTWMIIHRMSHSKHPDIKFFRQRFYMQFQQDVERRVYDAGVQIGVSKWLKKLEEHFYKTGIGLDELLSGASREPLEEALLKAYYGGEEGQRANAQLLARYVTRELQCLALTDEAAIFLGHVRFSTQLLADAVARAGVTSPSQDEDEAKARASVVGGKAAPATAGTAGAPAEPGVPSASGAAGSGA